MVNIKNLFFFVLLIGNILHAQNLVPNPSFEIHDSLPCDPINPGSPLWLNIDDYIDSWFAPTSGTSDIHSTLVNPSCYAHAFSTHYYGIGSEQPRTGDVMAGMITYLGSPCGNPTCYDGYREYLSVKLSKPLQINKKYYVEYWISRGDSVIFASNNFGAYFSDTMVSITVQNNAIFLGKLPFVPQVNFDSVVTNSLGWSKVSGCFTASSSAEYLVIGNFYDDSASLHPPQIPIPQSSTFGINYSYYYIDDVTVIEHVDSSDISAGPDLEICIGDTISIQAMNGDNYIWDNGVQDSILTVSPDSTTIYTVTENNSCGSDQVTVFVNLLPEPIVFIQQNQELSTFAFASYQWYLNGVMIPNATNQNYVFTQNGQYKVEVTDFLGCSNFSQPINIDFVGLEKSKEIDKFEIYPNPSAGNIFIKTTSKLIENYQVDLFNPLGELLISYKMLNGNAELKTESLTRGMYLLRIYNKNESKVFNLILN